VTVLAMHSRFYRQLSGRYSSASEQLDGLESPDLQMAPAKA
jgi:hypothetical protein